MGSSLSPVTMTGTTFHQEGAVPPWRKVRFLFALELIEQATFAAFRPVTLLIFQQSFPSQVVASAADSGLGQLPFLGNGRDGRPALTALVGTSVLSSRLKSFSLCTSPERTAKVSLE